MSLTSLTDKSASASARLSGSIDLVTKSSTSDSSFARVTLTFMCLGPVASAVTYGKLTSVCCAEESSIFAFSAASLTRCIASGSVLRSIP